MIKNAIKRAANAVGLDIHKYSKAEWRWSYHVGAYYPVDPISRWGYGKPPHPQITEILNQGRDNILSILRQFSQCSGLLASVPVDRLNPKTPYWKNRLFENFDAAALVSMLVSRAPARYVEIGSGNSTKFARYAIEQARLSTSITSIDPEPRAMIDELCDSVIRRRLEDCDLSFFDQLQPGDFLFFDGSHRVFTNSDVTVFFLEVMPRLKQGVIIHIHDIFLPWDYPPDWNQRMYSEQYIVAAMLLCPRPLFKVLLPNLFICEDREMRVYIQSLLEPLGCIAEGWSLWVEKL